MVENLPAPASSPTRSPLTLRTERESETRILKAGLKVALDLGEEVIKAVVPGGGPLIKIAKGILDLSDASEEAQPDERIDRLDRRHQDSG